MVDLNRVLESAINYCENDPKGYKHCMKVFHDMGLKYTMDVLASAGLLPSEYAKDEPSCDEKMEWEWLTEMAMGDPEVVAKDLMEEVAKWCWNHSDDPLECLEMHSPDYFDDVAQGYFIPQKPYDIIEKMMSNIDHDTWERIEKEYAKLWRQTYKDWRNYFRELEND